MTHSITLELPENVYRILDEEAKAKGRKVEEIALEKLENGETKEIEDPFEKFIGAFRSDVPDWAENHDKYLDEELAKDLKVEK